MATISAQEVLGPLAECVSQMIVFVDTCDQREAQGRPIPPLPDLSNVAQTVLVQVHGLSDVAHQFVERGKKNAPWEKWSDEAKWTCDSQVLNNAVHIHLQQVEFTLPDPKQGQDQYMETLNQILFYREVLLKAGKELVEAAQKLHVQSTKNVRHQLADATRALLDSTRSLLYHYDQIEVIQLCAQIRSALVFMSHAQSITTLQQLLQAVEPLCSSLVTVAQGITQRLPELSDPQARSILERSRESIQTDAPLLIASLKTVVLSQKEPSSVQESASQARIDACQSLQLDLQTIAAWILKSAQLAVSPREREAPKVIPIASLLDEMQQIFVQATLFNDDEEKDHSLQQALVHLQSRIETALNSSHLPPSLLEAQENVREKVTQFQEQMSDLLNRRQSESQNTEEAVVSKALETAAAGKAAEQALLHYHGTVQATKLAPFYAGTLERQVLDTKFTEIHASLNNADAFEKEKAVLQQEFSKVEVALKEVPELEAPLEQFLPLTERTLNAWQICQQMQAAKIPLSSPAYTAALEYAKAVSEQCTVLANFLLSCWSSRIDAENAVSGLPHFLAEQEQNQSSHKQVMDRVEQLVLTKSETQPELKEAVQLKWQTVLEKIQESNDEDVDEKNTLQRAREATGSLAHLLRTKDPAVPLTESFSVLHLASSVSSLTAANENPETVDANVVGSQSSLASSHASNSGVVVTVAVAPQRPSDQESVANPVAAAAQHLLVDASHWTAEKNPIVSLSTHISDQIRPWQSDALTSTLLIQSTRELDKSTRDLIGWALHVMLHCSDTVLRSDLCSTLERLATLMKQTSILNAVRATRMTGSGAEKDDDTERRIVELSRGICDSVRRVLTACESASVRWLPSALDSALIPAGLKRFITAEKEDVGNIRFTRQVFRAPKRQHYVAASTSVAPKIDTVTIPRQVENENKTVPSPSKAVAAAPPSPRKLTAQDIAARNAQL